MKKAFDHGWWTGFMLCNAIYCVTAAMNDLRDGHLWWMSFDLGLVIFSIAGSYIEWLLFRLDFAGEYTNGEPADEIEEV